MGVRIGAMPLGSVMAKLHALLALIDRDGEEARVVGAAVRNTLLQLPVAEIDVGTTALLEEVMSRVRAAGGKAADRHLSTAPSPPSSIITRSRSRRRSKMA